MFDCMAGLSNKLNLSSGSISNFEHAILSAAFEVMLAAIRAMESRQNGGKLQLKLLLDDINYV